MVLASLWSEILVSTNQRINMQREAQRELRNERLGQTKPTFVLELLTQTQKPKYSYLNGGV